MMKFFALWVASIALCSQFLAAQEADAGFDLRGTFSGQATASNLSTEPPRSGSLGTAGFRSVFYPTWKLSEHWTVSGAWQLYSRPYFYSDLSTVGYGANGDLILATLNYSRVSDQGSILIRAGQLPTAFGSFPLRYDDTNNALVDLPLNMATTGPYRHSASPAPRWMPRAANGTGERSSSTRLRQILAPFSRQTNTVTGPEAGDILSARAFGSGARDFVGRI
jgi:hypothetical protein